MSALNQIIAPPDPSGLWIPAIEAAPKLDLHPNHVARLCRDDLEKKGLAKFCQGPDGGQLRWFIHTSYSAKLIALGKPESEKLPDLRDKTEKQRKLAPLKKICVDKLRCACASLPAGQRMADAVAGIIEYARAELPSLRISDRSLYRWDRALVNPRDLSPLCDGRGGKRESSGDDEAWKMMIDLVSHPHGPSRRQCWRMVKIAAKQNGWKWPNRDAAIKQLPARLPIVKQIFNRERGRYDRTMSPFTAQKKDAWAAGERWVTDHKLADFFCLFNGKPARPWITSIQDWRSRKIVGWRYASHRPRIRLSRRSAWRSKTRRIRAARVNS